MPAPSSTIDPTGHHPGVRLWLLVSALASGVLYMAGFGLVVGGFVAHDRHLMPVMFISGYGVILLGVLLVYVKIGLALYWLHGAWKWVPMEQRFTQSGKRIGPGEVFMLLIPYYHYYWMFPVNMGLCEVMERLRAHYVREPRTEPPARDTAMWAAICEIIPFANFFIAPFLWGSYMRRIDVMHDEIERAMRAGP